MCRTIPYPTLLSLLTTLMALSLFSSCGNQKSQPLAEVTGTIEDIPGYSNKKLDYYINVDGLQTATVADDRASLRLVLCNPEQEDISIVVCAMLNLTSQTVSHQGVEIQENGGVWTCTKMGSSNQHPSVHLGCKQVTIPAGQQLEVFNEQVTFDRTFLSTDLALYYFDILLDGTVDSSCDCAKGTNILLYPDANQSTFSNIWAGHSAYTKTNCKPSPFPTFAAGYLDHLVEEFGESDASPEEPSTFNPVVSTASWEPGNWVTMGYPNTYPSRIVGTVSNLVNGTEVRLLLGGALLGSYVTQPDTSGGPCDALDLVIDELFSISPTSGIMSFELALGDSVCGNFSSGEIARFKASVFAEPGAPFYNPGDRMHGIDLLFIHDSEPPGFLQADVSTLGSNVLVEVVGGDLVGPPTRASLVWDTGGPPTTTSIAPSSPSILPLFSRSASFEELVTGLPTGVTINYHIELRDEFKNIATSPTSSFVIGGGQ